MIIAMTVFLILLSIQLQATRSNFAQSSRYVASSQAKEFASWMEEDLDALGRNMDSDEWPFDVPNKRYSEQSPSDSISTRFVFYHDTTDASGNHYQVTTAYDVDSTGTETVGDTTKTVYEVTRSRGGQSSGMLTYFDVDLLDRNANPLANPATPDTVRSFRVRFGVVSPFQNENTVLHEINRSIIVRNHHAEE